MDDRTRLELLAWQLVLPTSSAITHLSAARLCGWWLPPLPEDLPVFVCMPRCDPRPRRRGLRVVRHPLPPATEIVLGLRCVTAPEILLACARDVSLLDLVVLLDSALHAGDVTPEELWEIAGRRRRGAPRLRAALALADGRSESPWET